MKEFIKQIKSDKIMWYGLVASLIIILISSIYVAIIYHLLPPFIPLFNQLPWGIERLSDKIGILLPLCYMVFVYCINFILAKMLYNTLPLVSRLIIITTLILGLTTVIFIIRITQLLI